MKFKQAIVLVAVSLFFVLAAQEASAYYHAPMGRWLTRDPFFTGSLQGKESLMGTPEYNNLYNYVTNSPTGSVDPSGLKKPNAVKSPCGTFSFEDYTDPGRPEPGYEVGFDPEGCPPCERGHIKLVQVIDPLGSGSTGPHFDVGKKAPPKGTKYPGYCQTGNRCGRSPDRGRGVDGPIQDAPDIRIGKAEGHNIVICAVCDKGGGDETVLGCFNFQTNEDQDGFDKREPNVPGLCVDEGRYPARDAHPDWNKGIADWEKRKERYLK